MPTVDGSGEYVPGHRPIDDTDLEISYNLPGKDLVLRVNKAGVMVFRVLLEGAAKELQASPPSHRTTLLRWATRVRGLSVWPAAAD